MNTQREFLAWMAAAAALCATYELQNPDHQVTVLQAQLGPRGRIRTLRECFAPGQRHHRSFD